MNKKLLIDWKLNKICNFECSYCFKKDAEILSNNPSKDEICMALNVLDSLHFDKFHILFSGGEPTLFKDLNFFVNKATEILNNKLYKITIISNCGISKPFSDSILENKKVQIYYSIHSEFYNKKHTQSIIEQISKNTELYVAIMYNPNEIEKSKNIINEIKNLKKLYNFDCKVILLRQYPHFMYLDEKYNKEDYEYVNEINKEFGSDYNEYFNDKIEDHNILIQENRLAFKNYYCAQGTQVLRINEDGFCAGSICGSAKKSHFSIYKGINPYLMDFPSYVRCKLKHCGCKDNLYIEKFKEKEDVLEYIKKWKSAGK